MPLRGLPQIKSKVDAALTVKWLPPLGSTGQCAPQHAVCSVLRAVLSRF